MNDEVYNSINSFFFKKHLSLSLSTFFSFEHFFLKSFLFEPRELYKKKDLN